MDYKKDFERFKEHNAFIKVSAPEPIESAQKAALNRKGNVFFNSGEIEKARRIFLTTGYSDGISRVGDYYKSQNRLIDAMHMYYAAPDKTKLEPLLSQLALILQGFIHEESSASPSAEGLEVSEAGGSANE